MSIEVTFICPSHNRCKMLEECARSILDDSPGTWELVITDDGSTDDTPRICQELQLLYGVQRVVVSRTETNHGAQVARNRGLRSARGKYVVFVDSDDVMITRGVMRLVEELHSDPTLDYAYGKVVRTDERLKPLVGPAPIGAPFSAALVEVAGWHWHTMGAVYRRSYLGKVGTWNEALSGSQDWEYQARVKLAGGRGEFVDTVVGFWREHGGSRVGTNVFRPDYCRSLMIAFETVLRLAREKGRCDGALEARLAKKMALVGLEWGANNCARERSICLDRARGMLSGSHLLRLAILATRFCPSWADGMVWRYLVGKKV